MIEYTKRFLPLMTAGLLTLGFATPSYAQSGQYRATIGVQRTPPAYNATNIVRFGDGTLHVSTNGRNVNVTQYLQSVRNSAERRLDDERRRRANYRPPVVVIVRRH